MPNPGAGGGMPQSGPMPQTGGGAPPMPPGGGPSYFDGGMVGPGGSGAGMTPGVGAIPAPQAGTGKPVKATIHEGEYIIPHSVVMRKGTEFFDKLLEPPAPKKPGG